MVEAENAPEPQDLKGHISELFAVFRPDLVKEIHFSFGISQEEAEDLVSLVFVKILDLTSRQSFSTLNRGYLYIACRHLAMNHSRDRRRRTRALRRARFELDAHTDPLPQEFPGFGEQLQEVLDGLKFTHKTVLELIAQEKTQAEIAQSLSMNLGATNSLIARARKALKRALRGKPFLKEWQEAR